MKHRRPLPTPCSQPGCKRGASCRIAATLEPICMFCATLFKKDELAPLKAEK